MICIRLWHQEIVKFLPTLQLIAQWRELNSIYTKEDKHILINYIYGYSKDYLYNYSNLVLGEIKNRNIKIRTWDKFRSYFMSYIKIKVNKEVVFEEHNDRYLLQCFFNLQEKLDSKDRELNGYANKLKIQQEEENSSDDLITQLVITVKTLTKIINEEF